MFNTEAHPVDVAALYCCSSEKSQHTEEVEKILSHVDLLRMIGAHGEIENVVHRKKKKKVMEKQLEMEEENSENWNSSGDEKEAMEYEEEVTESDKSDGNFYHLLKFS